jgi:tetrahydromethanopterin S-methyltransferase subunit D
MLLRRTKLSSAPDYEVIDASGRAVGRIYLSVTSSGDRWVWAVYGVGSGPAADTLDKAKAAFKAMLARAK